MNRDDHGPRILSVLVGLCLSVLVRVLPLPPGSESLHPLHAIPAAALAEREAGAELLEVAVEDVVAVPRAVHPGFHHLRDGGLPFGDVLADRPPLIAGVLRALAHGV